MLIYCLWECKIVYELCKTKSQFPKKFYHFHLTEQFLYINVNSSFIHYSTKLE